MRAHTVKSGRGPSRRKRHAETRDPGPAGTSHRGALSRLGYAGVADVRQGKRFELEFDGEISDSDLESIAEALLANTVIEDWEIVRESE